jgi:hypothetical protein
MKTYELNKKLLIESLFVGVYSCIIYLFVISYVVTTNFILLLFVTGFLKHLLGHYLKIQEYYCKTIVINCKAKVSIPYLIFEGILEGIAFIMMGLLLNLFIEDWYILMFLLGFLLHIVAEFTGVHEYFCNYRCTKIPSNISK